MGDPIGDFIRNLDPATRAFIVIFLSAMGHTFLAGWWMRFKDAEQAKPTQTRLRGGVYVPWGRVERIQRVGKIIFWIWLVWMAVMLVALGYMKFMGYSNLF